MTATERARHHLAALIDPASVTVFRIGFGALATFAAVRFVARGWVSSLLLQPDFHFTWVPGLPTLPAPLLYGMFAIQALAGVGIALGWRTRLCLTAWLLSFGYVELLDKTLYLNHYVLFTLLGTTLWIVPTGQGGLPRWALWLLRIEVGLVYVWAGIAKLNADWLFRGEPLRTWMQARVDVPVVGPWLATDVTAVGMSWGGALYDLSIPFLLLWPRTRAVGLLLVVGFHGTVGVLFPIGVFPWLMILSATVFLEPDWPRRWMRSEWTAPVARPALSWPGTVALAAVVFGLAVFPGRFALWGTDVNWTERGYRFSWRVMLNEKTGMVDYRVVEPATGRRWRVMPADELTPLQHKQMRTQPDMIRDYALHLQAQHRKAGREVAVYADAWASLNGRPAQRLLRPDVDLTRSLGALERAGWIVERADPSRGSVAQ